MKLSLFIQVAAISGDARRALEICRRAAEIADYRIKKLATNPDNVAAGILCEQAL
jgi:origin recognition complex subunit 1